MGPLLSLYRPKHLNNQNFRIFLTGFSTAITLVYSGGFLYSVFPLLGYQQAVLKSVLGIFPVETTPKGDFYKKKKHATENKIFIGGPSPMFVCGCAKNVQHFSHGRVTSSFNLDPLQGRW